MFGKLFKKKEVKEDISVSNHSDFKMRDTRKSKDYFLNKLQITDENVSRILKIHDSNIKANNQKGLDVTNFCLSEVLFSYPETWYSIGKKIDESWIMLYSNYFPCFLNSIGENNIYQNIIKILSIGVLLNIEDEYFIRLSSKLKEVKYQDSFIDFLVNSRCSQHKVSEKILFRKYIACETLSKLSQLQGQEAIDLINIYLNKYFYTKESIGREFNSHKQANNMYNGYWAWEIAAIVKIKQLNDSSLKENPYYPYDIVHWNNI